MKVLVACEESQTVCIEFRNRGHEAYSCDIQPCSGGHPEWHIQDDAIEVLHSQKWDLVIAHPPCTRLTNTGVCWLHKRNLWDELREACNFFTEFVKYGRKGNSILIENPIPHKYALQYIPKYHQLIQPWQFGHTEQKATCLWLYNLPELKHTKNVYAEMMLLPYAQRSKIHYASPGPERAKERSKTFQGIAEAIADQYSIPYVSPQYKLF